MNNTLSLKKNYVLIFSPELKKSIDKAVLCWLASADTDLIPNVSPKEIFCHFEDKYLLIANIASPKSVKNIKSNPNICVSVLDILVQKGFQLKGTAEIIDKSHSDFELLKTPLHEMTGDKFPFHSLTKIKVESAKQILAPSYILYPETTSEEQQIAKAKKSYNLR